MKGLILAFCLAAASVGGNAVAQPSSAEDPDAVPGLGREQFEPEPLPPALQGVPVADLRIAGSVLRPRTSADGTTINPSGGCIFNASGSALGVLNTPVYLPQGGLVETLRFYFDDTSASSSTAWFTVYDLAGNIDAEFGVSSVGNAGFGSADTNPINHVIDYALFSYVINWRPVVSGSTMQACGFRIFYQPPELFTARHETGDTSEWTNAVE